jgi:TRAP-type C4-dicarboxylate transport system permease small subunit
LVLDKAEKIVRWAENILVCIAGLMFLLMMFLGAGDVLGRYLFNNPIRGTMEISELLMGGIVLFSWAYTQRRKGHVTVDLFIAQYPPRLRAGLNIVTLFLSLVLFVIITQQSTVLAMTYWQEHRVIPTIQIPTAPFHFFVPIGGLLLCIEFIIQMLRLIPDMRKG